MNTILLKEIWINAPVAEVFRSFTQAEAMLAWHGKEVELNPVPGGIYRVVFENGDVIQGEFKEVEQNKRVLYRASYGNVDSVIEINFIAENEGTTVKLRQEFFAGGDFSTFSFGWDYFLGKLKTAREGGISLQDCEWVKK